MPNGLTRLTLLLVALALAGCGHIVTLYPRGAGEKATGTLNDGSRNMSVTLKGVTYSGRIMRGQTIGLGFSQSFGGAPSFGNAIMMATTNQYSAVLTGSDDKSILRCELKLDVAIGGHGLCVDRDDVSYDMTIKAQ